MSSSTTKSGKRSKESSSLITPPSASNPPKVTKLTIPSSATGSSGLITPLIGIDSPASFVRSNFLKFAEDWRQRYNILTPHALEPLQQQNVQMEANQQVLADDIKTIQENGATKKDISVAQEEFSKTKQENDANATRREITLTQEEFMKIK